MTIEILRTKTASIGPIQARHVDIIITSGGVSYLWSVGGLPLTGSLQTILEAREPELWQAASLAGNLASEENHAQSGAKAWFVAHPNAALLFNLSIADLDTEVDDLVEDLFPLASAANKNRMKLWMKTVSHSIRALAKREGFT